MISLLFGHQLSEALHQQKTQGMKATSLSSPSPKLPDVRTRELPTDRISDDYLDVHPWDYVLEWYFTPELKTLLPERYYRDVPLLKRFIRGHGPHAQDRLMEMVKWREETKPDKILKGDIIEEYKTGKMFVHGVDRNGRPLIIVKMALHKPKKRKLDQTVKLLLYCVEKAIRSMGPGVHQFSIIIDRKDSTRRNTDLDLFAEFGNIRHYYPERLHRVYVVNVNFFWKMLLSMAKPFIEKRTLDKIIMVKNKEMKEILQKDISPEELLLEYSGSNTYKFGSGDELRESTRFDQEEEIESPKSTGKLADHLMDQINSSFKLRESVKERLRKSLTDLRKTIEKKESEGKLEATPDGDEEEGD